MGNRKRTLIHVYTCITVTLSGLTMELLKYFLKIQTHRIFLEQISREELMVDFYLG